MYLCSRPTQKNEWFFPSDNNIYIIYNGIEFYFMGFMKYTLDKHILPKMSNWFGEQYIISNVR